MKYSKKDVRVAKQILETSLKNGNLDEGKLVSLVQSIKKLKLRNTKVILLALVKELTNFYKNQTIVVESTQSLPPDQLSEIKKYFEIKLGKTLNLQFKQNNSLIAGIKVILGDNVWDYSLNSQLENFKVTNYG